MYSPLLPILFQVPFPNVIIYVLIAVIERSRRWYGTGRIGTYFIPTLTLYKRKRRNWKWTLIMWLASQMLP